MSGITWKSGISFTSYGLLLDTNGAGVTGAAGNLVCKVLDEADGVFSTPAVSEVDSTNAPGLYKASFTPDAHGLWKTHWKSTSPSATVMGGEIINVIQVIEEKSSFTYPGTDATEKDVTELLTTPWSTFYAKRRHHKIMEFDWNAVLADVNVPNITVREYLKEDATNWRKVSEVVHTNATAMKALRMGSMYASVDYKITMQLSAGLSVGRTVYYNQLIELEEP